LFLVLFLVRGGAWDVAGQGQVSFDLKNSYF
jgi:hypothetical protein